MSAMRFATQSRFGITADALPCPNPWDETIVYQLHRLGGARHRKLMKQAVASDPVTARSLAQHFDAEARRLRAEIERKQAPKDAAGNGKPAVAVLPETAPEPEKPLHSPEEQSELGLQLALYEAMRDALASGDVSAMERFSPDKQNRELVAGLLAGWTERYEDGELVPFTPENVEAVLTCETEVAEGHPYAGWCMGDALVAHLLKFATEHSMARTKALTAMGKGSEPSSAGSSKRSARSRRSSKKPSTRSSRSSAS